MISPDDALAIATMLDAVIPVDVSKHYNLDNLRDLLNEADDIDDSGLMPVEAAIAEIKMTLEDAFKFAEVEAIVKRFVPDRNVMYVYDNEEMTGYTVVFDDGGTDMQIATKMENDE